jgi:hypothetical protein
MSKHTVATSNALLCTVLACIKDLSSRTSTL